MKAQKKSVIIDFQYYNGTKQHIIDFVESFGDIFEDHFTNVPMGMLSVKTLEGTSYDLIADKHVVIRGVEGEYYPCEINIFHKTYDVIDEN